MRKRGKKRKKRSRIGSSADYCEYREEWWGGQEQRGKKRVRRRGVNEKISRKVKQKTSQRRRDRGRMEGCEGQDKVALERVEDEKRIKR